jgi:hypothetical protein
MATTTNKPFAVKGMNLTTPIGEALWCKHSELDTKFNAKGMYSTQLVCDPNDETVKAFINKVEELREVAYRETVETLGGAKGKAVKEKELYEDHFDRDGNETGMIVFKLKMNNVADRKPGQNRIDIFDAQKNNLTGNCPPVGNGSKIRCAFFANPYYMASTKEVGISFLWTKLQVIELSEYGGGSDGDFDEVDGGFTTTATNSFDTVEEEQDDLDF